MTHYFKLFFKLTLKILQNITKERKNLKLTQQTFYYK